MYTDHTFSQSVPTVLTVQIRLCRTHLIIDICLFVLSGETSIHQHVFVKLMTFLFQKCEHTLKFVKTMNCVLIRKSLRVRADEHPAADGQL